MKYWLVKQEPEAYSFARFQQDRVTAWTGVRNFQARNNLRAMAVGDRVFYYHSVEERRIVGWGRVVKVAYPDPTATEGDWSCVDLEAIAAAPSPIDLDQMKKDPKLSQLPLIRQSRLSVMPISATEAKYLITKLGLKG